MPRTRAAAESGTNLKDVVSKAVNFYAEGRDAESFSTEPAQALAAALHDVACHVLRHARPARDALLLQRPQLCSGSADVPALVPARRRSHVPLPFRAAWHKGALRLLRAGDGDRIRTVVPPLPRQRPEDEALLYAVLRG